MDPIKLLFSGDFAPIGVAEVTPEKSSRLIIDNSLNDVINDCDIWVINLECPLTKSENKIAKTGPHLKAHPLSIKALKKLNVNIACLSNNHIRDYNDEGVSDTIELCKQHGIRTVGAGENKFEASAPLYIKIKGKVIAILNFSESEFNYADEKRAGSNPDDPIHIWRSIQTVKLNSDYQVVVMHGGKEKHPFPTPFQLDLFRFIADQGVNAVVGHHTHDIGGYEIYNNVPIVYSLGNFIFDDGNLSAAWHKGALLRLEIYPEGNCSCTLYQTHFNGDTLKIVNELKPGTTDIDNTFMKEIDIREVQDEWKKAIFKEAKNLVKSQLNLSKLRRGFWKCGFRYLTKREKHFLLSSLNRYQCKTHRELSISAIHYSLNL